MLARPGAACGAAHGAGSVPQVDRLEARVVEITSIVVDRAGDLDQSLFGPGLLRLARHRVGAGAEVGEHQVQHGVGLRFQLAVADDAGDFIFHLAGQGGIVRRRQLARMGGGQLRLDRVADALHARAQRLVGAPPLAMVERELGRGGGVVVMLGLGAVAGSECRRAGQRERGGHDEQVQFLCVHVSVLRTGLGGVATRASLTI